ncbi:MAG: hypothetical protein JST06_07160 [Bacteroidetes bacterium]|nr:hypothetical protein [Bacteroidota bacterium]
MKYLLLMVVLLPQLSQAQSTRLELRQMLLFMENGASYTSKYLKALGWTVSSEGQNNALKTRVRVFKNGNDQAMVQWYPSIGEDARTPYFSYRDFDVKSEATYNQILYWIKTHELKLKKTEKEVIEGAPDAGAYQIVDHYNNYGNSNNEGVSVARIYASQNSLVGYVYEFMIMGPGPK